MDKSVINTVYAVIVAAILTWAVMASLVVLYWRKRWQREKSRRARLFMERGMLWRSLEKERAKRLGLEKAAASMQQAMENKLASTQLALEMEQKNMEITHEHLKYYIEALADMEKLVLIKDEELEKRDARELPGRYDVLPDGKALGKPMPCVVGCAVVHAYQWVLAKKLQDLDNLRGVAKSKLEEVKAAAQDINEELSQEFDELRAGKDPAPEFGEYGDAYDPKVRVEAEDENQLPA